MFEPLVHLTQSTSSIYNFINHDSPICQGVKNYKKDLVLSKCIYYVYFPSVQMLLWDFHTLGDLLNTIWLKFPISPSWKTQWPPSNFIILLIFFFLPSPMAISFCYIYQGNLIISPPTQHAHTVAHSINLPITKFSHSRYVIIFVILLKTTFRSIVGACSEHINKGVESTLKCDDVHYIADLKNATYISKNTYLTSQHLYNVQAQGRWLWFA